MQGIPDLPAPRKQAGFILLHFVMESSELPRSTFCCISFFMRDSFSVQFFFFNSWAHNFQKPILGNNIWLTKYICKKKIYFCLFPYLILENIVQPGLSMKYLILVWLPELRVSPFFRVRKPMLTTSSAFLVVTAWIPV